MEKPWWVPHPNRISAVALLCTGAGVGIVYGADNCVSELGGLALIIAGDIGDKVDGFVAKKYENMKTKEGAKLDPLFDKGKNLLVGGYCVAKECLKENVIFPASMIANWGVNYYSQMKRGNIVNQIEEATGAIIFPENCKVDNDKNSTDRANSFGRVKALGQVLAADTYILYDILQSHNIINTNTTEWVPYVLASILGVSAGWGYLGVKKRIN